MANPFDKVANQYTAAQADAANKPKACPHCGRSDDVPEPNSDAAAAMQKGAMSGEIPASQMWANLKSGLGLGS